MHICNKGSRNGVYKKNTFSLSRRQDNAAEANVNTNRQSCMKTQRALTHTHTHTHTRTKNHIVHPINHPPTKQRSQTQPVFAGATALYLARHASDRFTEVGRGGALDCPCPFSSATPRQLSPCLSSDATPLIQPGHRITTQGRLIAISTGTGGSQHLLLDIS